MAENATSTIRATFETREAADLAVEHLVQQHGIARPDIFIQSASNENTTGTESSRGDVSRSDAPHEGEIEVSVDISPDQMQAVQRSFGDVGALRVSNR
ncbi:hypothetical protein [uncultured Agrobacterium sp.]|uniref:hypothetical protein n=1 Tax=uncultured Agrobacterium sp. TaxID=157277 RepID=UPI0025FAFB64|nr:hypothetical protein [uncultured Agrobacterium sp.]